MYDTVLNKMYETIDQIDMRAHIGIVLHIRREDVNFLNIKNVRILYFENE